MRLRTVLVPLEGSASSRSILPYIPSLLRVEDYTIILLRVGAPASGIAGVPTRPATLEMATYECREELLYARHPGYAVQAEANARVALEESLADARAFLEAHGFVVEVAVRFGAPADAIVAYAQERHVDMVALAIHNGFLLNQTVANSVAEQVLRNLTVPLLLLHPTDERSCS